MNKSVSKIRHILEANLALEKRKLISEENKKVVNKNEKDFFVDFLNAQRNLEKNGISFGDDKGGFNLLMREQEEQPQSGTTEDDIELTGDEEGLYDTEDGNINPDFEEFLNYYFQNFISKGNETQTVATESVYKTKKDIISESIITEQYNDFMLSDLRIFKNIKKWFKNLGRAWRRSDFQNWLDKRFNGDFRRFRKEFSRDYKQWLKKMKKWDIYINKNRQFQKTLYRSKGNAIKIGVWKYIKIGETKEADQTEMSSTEEYSTVTTPENYDTYLAENQRKMVSLMDDTSKAKWEELKADTENKAYAVAVLEYFNSTFKEKRWRKVSVGKTQEQFREEIKKEPKNFDVPPQEIVYPANDFVFPVNQESEPNLFKDNESDEANAPLFVQEVLAMCDQIKLHMEGFEAPEGKPKAYLQAYGMEASASRFRNTGRAENLTFLQLSEERVKTAEAIIYRELGNIGVLIDGDTQRTIKLDGTNGDGTSGPNAFKLPSGGYYFVPGGDCKMTPYCTKDGDKVCNKVCNRNEFGAPHASKAEYDKYKYIKGWFTIIFNDTILPEPEETPGDEGNEDKPEYQVIETVKYPVIMWSPPKKPFKIPLIGFKLKWNNVFEIKPRQRAFKGFTGNKPPRKGYNTLACPKF